MLNFLFWNCQRKDVSAMIAALTRRRQIDVVILAECRSAEEVLFALNAEPETGSEFRYFPTTSRVSILASFGDEYAPRLMDEPKFTIRHLQLPARDPLILVAAHLPSKRERQDADQDQESVLFSQDIQVAEESAGHTNTVLVGDLNMNPFQNGVVSAAGLHGAMTRRLARRNSRVVNRRRYPLF